MRRLALTLLVLVSCGSDRLFKVVPPMHDVGVMDAAHDASIILDRGVDVGPPPDLGVMEPPDASIPWIPVDGDHDLRAELYWNPQIVNDSTDVDLHLMHPSGTRWYNPPLDCYYANKTPLWDSTSTASPVLDHDVINGHGPENIVIKTIPEIEYGHAYRVGVIFFSNHGQADPSLAYVQISCHGMLFQFGPTALDDDDIWRVADVTFAQGSCVIAPVNLITHYGSVDYEAR